MAYRLQRVQSAAGQGDGELPEPLHLCTVHHFQQAAITALTGPQEDMQVMKQAFEQRRDHLVERA